MKKRTQRRKPKVVYKKNRQTGKSDKKMDKKRSALPPGKRISKNGNVYYEYRKNRSDRLKSEKPKK